MFGHQVQSLGVAALVTVYVDESICSSPRLLPHGNEILSHLSALLDENGKLSGEIRDQEEVVRDSVQQARTLCTTTVSSFVQALANALPQYAANGLSLIHI